MHDHLACREVEVDGSAACPADRFTEMSSFDFFLDAEFAQRFADAVAQFAKGK
jgi:hypothetical protein